MPSATISAVSEAPHKAKKPKEILGIRRRLLRLLSWITGISLGSAFLLVAGTLVAIAIIVRTEAFQNAVRDRVLKIARAEFNTEIIFESTEVNLFSLYPSLAFNKVHIRHPETKVEIAVDRLGVSLSLFLSVPLLFARQLSLEEVEVRGLLFELKDLKSLERLLARLRPKNAYLPSIFQTSLQRASLIDVAVDLDLAPSGVLQEAVQGKVILENAQLDFTPSAVDLSGAMRLENLRYGNFRPLNGRIELEDSSHNLKRSVISALRFQSANDRFEISGEIRNWKDPQLRFQGEAEFDLKSLESQSPLDGRVKTVLNLRGPLHAMQGEGKATLRSTILRHKTWANFDASWKLVDSKAVIEAHQVEAQGPDRGVTKGATSEEAKETVTLWASLPLKLDDRFVVSMKLSNAKVSDYLGLVAPDLQVWKGTMNGNLAYEADRARPLQGKASVDVTFKGFEIRGYPSTKIILATEVASLKAEMDFQDQGPAALKATLKLGALQADVQGRVSLKNVDLKGHLVSRGFVGSLIERKLEIEGSSPLRVEGPWKHFQLTAQPEFSAVTFEGHRLTNMRGTLIYTDYKLTGVPLEMDQLTLYGGLIFHRGDKDNEFAPLRFVLRDLSPAFIFSLIGIHGPLTDSIQGRLEGRGQLRGPLRRPMGSGSLKIRDWLFYKMTAKGFLAQGKWATAGHDFFFDQMLLRFHDDQEVVNGEMAFDGGGLLTLSFDSDKLRWGHLQNVFGWSLPLQASTRFAFDYQRDVPSLEIKCELQDTLLSGLEQPDSRGHLLWDGNDGVVTGQLFGSAVTLEGRGSTHNQLRTTKLDISVTNFSLGALSRTLSQARLDWGISGQGKVEIRQQLETPTLIENLFQTKAGLEGLFKVQASSVSRAGAVLHRIEPFEIKMENQAHQNTRWSVPSLVLKSERGDFSSSGYVENRESFHFQMKGPLDLRVGTAFFPLFSRSEGWLNVDGALKSDGFHGRLALKDAFVNVQNSPFFIRNGEADLESRGAAMTLKRLKGDFREGSLEGEGSATVVAGQVKSGDLHIRLKDSLFQPQQGVSFKASGPVDIQIRDQKGLLAGELVLRDAIYRRRIDMKADLLKWTRPSRLRADWDEEEKSFWENWALNLRIKSLGAVVFRNNLVDGSANLNLKAQGLVGDPRLMGSVDIVKGQFYYVNRQFQVRSGSVQFSDPISNIPLFDIRADTEISDYRVFIQIKGSGENQKVSYSSEPPLNEKQILQLVLSGIPPQSSQDLSAGSLRPATSAEDPTRSLSWSGITFVTGRFQDRIEQGLYSNLGIRRFGLSPAFSDSTRSTELQLTVGTDLIRNRLEVNYSNMLSTRGGHKVELELRVNRNFSLIGSWRNVEGGSEQDFGGDFRFRFEVE